MLKVRGVRSQPLILFISAALICGVIAASLWAAPAQGESLEPFLQAGSRAISGLNRENTEGHLAFVRFREAVAGAAEAGGQPRIALQIRGLEPGRPIPPETAGLASRLLRHYTVACYGQSMINDLQEIVGFRTQAEAGRENWHAAEFERQRRWLEQRCRTLGLSFQSVDGRVDEITLAGPEPILAVLTHGDVQGVEGQNWSSPPWEGRLVKGRIIGRGTEDDKGPIVATLYAMAAIRDTGWAVNSTIRLLISNGEESSWEEIPYYLERRPMPQRTVSIDASYPVTFAQKGFGVVTIKADAGSGDDSGGTWRVASMSGGSELSIIPETGEAILVPESEVDQAVLNIKGKADQWSARHPPGRMTVARDDGRIKVTAWGKGGHSSEPHGGHNALGDLTAFLSTLDLKMDAWGALASFLGQAVGIETDGRSLGIAHTEEVTGALTVNLAVLSQREQAPVALINTRVPRGISNEEITRRLNETAKAFNNRTGGRIAIESQLLAGAHVADESLVSTLLSVWEEVTGRPGKPVAIGGGTQARLFTGGVDFGPALSMEHYRGHGTDEYLTPEELHRIAELTVAAVWKLTGEKP